MAQRPIEMILMRQVAGSLSVPVCLVDDAGALLYCNEPAENLLGRPLEEIGRLALSEWAALLSPTDETGEPLNAAALPVSVAVREQRPVHRVIGLRVRDGRVRRVAMTAFPMIGQNGRRLGGVAILWDT
jgi:PAS domain-containing protein